MKKILVSIALVASAITVASCAGETIISDGDPVSAAGTGYVFTLTAGTENAAARTALSGSDDAGYSVIWAKGDSFAQFYSSASGDSKLRRFSLIGEGGGTSGEFGTQTATEEGDVSVMAVYPYDLATFEGGIVKVELPRTQQYSDGGASLPMYAVCSDMDGDLRFKNMTGILSLRVNGKGKLRAVTLSSKKAMSGDFVLGAAEGGGYVLSSGDEVYDEVHMNCMSKRYPLEIPEGGLEFNFYLPEDTYDSLTVTFDFQEGEYNGYCVRTCKEPVIIERSKITPASISVSPDGAYVGTRSTKSFDREQINTLITEMISSNFGINPGDTKYNMVNGVIELYIKPLIPENKSFTVSKINYFTPSLAGGYALASGIVAYSSDIAGSGTFDRIVSVQHGTCNIDNAPSTQDFSVELCPVLSMKKGECRDLVVLADYIGYGSSWTTDLQQTYMHMKYTGSACADMIRAAENYLRKSGDMLKYSEAASSSKPIALCGYSQGGEASIATLFALEDMGYSDRIVDVRPGAGPHDLLAMLDHFIHLGNTASSEDCDYIPYSRTGYIPYMIRGILYGDREIPEVAEAAEHLNYIYASPAYSKSGMFDSSMLDTWHSELGENVRDVLHPDFFLADPDKMNEYARTLYQRAIDNSNVSRKPQNADKITLYHFPYDDQVPYACSVSAAEAWGCNLIDLTGVIPSEGDEIIAYSHILCAIEYYLRYLGGWDDSYRIIFSLIRSMLF